jgi:hypothetical protein
MYNLLHKNEDVKKEKLQHWYSGKVEKTEDLLVE